MTAVSQQNFCSDGDYGLGLELRKLMRESDNRNVVCVTTRTCTPDHVHLGRKRFQYVRDTATEAIKTVEHQTCIYLINNNPIVVQLKSVYLLIEDDVGFDVLNCFICADVCICIVQR